MLFRKRLIVPRGIHLMIAAGAAFLFGVLPGLEGQSDFKCPTGSRTCEINIATQNPSADEKTTGPKIIVVKGANTLRYDYVFKPTVSFTPGPAIDLFTLGTSGTVGGAAKKPGDVVPVGAEVAVPPPPKAPEQSEIDSLEQSANEQIDSANRATVLANRASEDIQSLLQNSDGILSVSAGQLKSEIDKRQIDEMACPLTDSATLHVFKRGVCARWPEIPVIASLLSSAQKLQAKIKQGQIGAQASVSELDQTLAAIEDGKASAQLQSLLKARKRKVDLVAQYDEGLKRLASVISALSDLNGDGKKYKEFASLKASLNKWNQRMIALSKNPDPFTLTPFHKASCGFAFSKTKSLKEELIRTDRLSTASAAGGSPTDASSVGAKGGSSTSATTTIPLVTVECTSPFALSAGFAFSSITERDFLIQPVPDAPNATTTTNRFTTDAHSSFHPLPVAMVNMRYHEFNRMLSLHGSFGVAANIKGQSAGGTDAEYLMTPLTVGLFRTAFISPALHIGREVRLGSNFHEGDVVPPNITTPPLQKSYKIGFALAITFSKP